MAEEADVVIAWAHGGIPNSVHSAFSRPTKFINLPNPDSWAQSLAEYGFPSPVRGMIAKFAPGVTPLRVALLGFSASCQGVAQVLSSGDGGRVDSVLAIDGIHTGYSDKAKHTVNPNGMRPWLDYGKLAVVNERLFVDSHSSVVPPNYASTTETADYLWDTLTGSAAAFVEPPLPDLTVAPTSVHVAAGPATGPDRTVQYPAPPWQPPRRAGGLVILGCDNLDSRGTADHIYQAKRILPLVLTELLARRWNEIDPKGLVQTCFLGDRPRHPIELFTFGTVIESKPKVEQHRPSQIQALRCFAKDSIPHSVGLAIAVPKCGKQEVLPANYMSTTDTRYLPGAGPSGGGGSKGSIVPWVVGGLVVAGFAAFALTGSVLEENPRRRAVRLPDGVAKRKGVTFADVDPQELATGTEHELEHTSDRRIARQIALDHLAEDPHYYRKLDRMEKGLCPNPNPEPKRVAVHGVLAGAYRAGALERTLLTHAVVVDEQGRWIEEKTVCRRIDAETLCDVVQKRGTLPTCPTCLERVQKRGYVY